MNITPFQFESRAIRVVTDDNGEPWFSAKEVCDVLGYGNPHQALASHVDVDDLQKLEAIDSVGRTQQTNHINESGLYALIFGSTKEEAKRFKRWVTHEVLPSIRKTGSYAAKAASHSSGLPQYRKARAIDMATRAAERICAQFPRLGESARQVVFAKLVNPAAGDEVIALPRVQEHHYSATEVGERYGITSNMVGRIANEHDLKTSEFGEFRLDKSRHSSKQVESFLYNERGAERVGEIAASIAAKAVVSKASSASTGGAQ
ncbi:BRO-N domain-containing protein [Thauera aromatica]|uniref:Phage antirepressor protein n=1 Tax=Thauera aromatica K172 TaxID=44139 RepID=A0A2R4BNU4_THAAR|nr:Bro-N domain-containing protein [Thauera aromatica]AVR88998.1 Phage antirepressor protein [Thauera aromatica K172]